MILAIDEMRLLLLQSGARDVSDEAIQKAAQLLDEEWRDDLINLMMLARAHGHLRADMVWAQ